MSAIDTRSALLGLLIMGDGLHNNDWGDQTSLNLEILENAVAGMATVDVSAGGTITLTSDQTVNHVIVFTGAMTANANVVFPAVVKNWILVCNTTGAFNLTLQIAGGASPVSIDPGSSALYFTDGINMVTAAPPPPAIGIVEEFYGWQLPGPHYVWANGAAISRTANAAAFNALNPLFAGDLAVGSTTVNNVSTDPTLIGLIGAKIEAVGIAPGTTITAATSTTLTLSAAPTVAGTAVALRAFPYGNGDGATTFNIPDRRELVAVGRSGMGGTGTRNQTTTFPAGGTALGTVWGEQLHVLLLAELAQHSHGLTDPTHAHPGGDTGHSHSIELPLTPNSLGSASGQSPSNGNHQWFTDVGFAGVTVFAAATGISVNNTGSNTAHNNIQPCTICNFILRIS